MNRVFVDFEMNPVSKKQRENVALRQEIIEIGAVRMDADYRVTDTFRAYIKPAYNECVTSGIYRLTGIRSRDVADRPLLQAGLAKFIAWCGEDFLRIYAWSDSDLAQLRTECQVKEIDCPLLDKRHAHWVDFQRIYCRVLGERRAVKLEYALDCCGITPEGALHDAADDAANSARLMAYLHSPDFEKHRQALAAVHKQPERQMGNLPSAIQQQLAALLAEMQE